MIVSLPMGDKGVGLFVHDVMGNFPILKVLSAFSQKAVKCVFNSNCCYEDEVVLVNCTLNNLQPQSGIDMTAKDNENSTQQENVGFKDNEVDVITEIPYNIKYTQVDSSQNVDLGSFLQRPVQIYEQSWQIGTNLTAATSTFDPWYEYFFHPLILKKLDNYYLLRCNLHLKFVINASPFYYGSCLVAYTPITSYPVPPIVTHSNGYENISLSQRPHLYLYPQNSQGGDMVLPFLYPKNWLDATNLADLISMGTIDLNSLTSLYNANGLTTDSINIKVYAWTEDLEIAGPTVKLALQSGKDEYFHNGTISKPASAIARAAGKLGSLPVIGPFATATSYAAGAIGDIAALFGYTNVPVIDDVHAFKPKSYPNIATTDIGTPIEKLTLDAKNELTVDTKVAGADVDDELIISDFCKRESFIYSTTWTATDTVDTGLFYSRVTPNMQQVSSITGGESVWFTPMGYVSRCFRYWRGDIKFTFKFICSQYHRGRVRINWDPIGDITTSGNYTTESYTRIVDITEETEVSICVPYTQALGYLATDVGVATRFGTTTTGSGGAGDQCNGYITMRVLNSQTSPVASADIKVLVFVSGCDNLEFAAPLELINTFSPYAPQSGQYDINENVHEIGLKPSMADPNINLVYMGERCVSLRQLLRRTSKYKRYITDENSTARLYLAQRIAIGRAPEYPGYDPLGNEAATGLISGISEPYNLVSWNYTTWFSLCFIGSRGSYNYLFNPICVEPVGSLLVTRKYASRTTPIYEGLAAPNSADIQRDYINTDNFAMGMSGSSLISQRTLAGTVVSAPMYSRYKFLMNDPLSRTDGTAVDFSNRDTLYITTTTLGSATNNQSELLIDTYVSAGTDFSLVFFLNAPCLYLYSSLPVV